MVTAKQIVREMGAGSVTKAAAAMGVSRQAIYNWLRDKQVPELYRDRFEVRKARQKPQDRAGAVLTPKVDP